MVPKFLFEDPSEVWTDTYKGKVLCMAADETHQVPKWLVQVNERLSMCYPRLEIAYAHTGVFFMNVDYIGIMIPPCPW